MPARWNLWPVGRRAALCALLAGLAACTNDRLIDVPIVNRLAWYNYIDSTSLRENCVPGQPLRARFVYNADYQQQVRVYNLVGDGAGGAFIKTRVQEGGTIDIARFTLEDPTAPLGGWKESLTRLTPGQLDSLLAALRASGAFAPPPEGLRLQSSQYYWLSGICQDGTFSFHAWRAGTPDFAQLGFPELLFAHDGTGVAVRPPEAIGAEAILRSGPARKDDRRGPQFTVQVGSDGLIGL